MLGRFAIEKDMIPAWVSSGLGIITTQSAQQVLPILWCLPVICYMIKTLE
jgi:hypothetical protein